MLQRFISLGKKASKRIGKSAGYGWKETAKVINPRRLRASFKRNEIYGGRQIDFSFAVGDQMRQRIKKYAPKFGKWGGGAATIGGATYLGTVAAERTKRRRRRR